MATVGTDLVRRAEVLQPIGGLVLLTGVCRRQSCRRLLGRVVPAGDVERIDPPAWCGNTCRTADRHRRQQRRTPSVSVSGRCPHCGAWFTYLLHQGSEHLPRFCSRKCQLGQLACPGCGKVAVEAGKTVCWPCWYLLTRSCYGKQRHAQEGTARRIALRLGSTAVAYRCALCTSWHVGKLGKLASGRYQEDQSRIAAALRAVNGQRWITALFTGWSGVPRPEPWVTPTQPESAGREQNGSNPDSA